uniref:Uncharacterized protein n=1 Tax=Anguilla anguilla TaxID=7936 RepID=A0A0E9QWU3_ANGAN
MESNLQEHSTHLCAISDCSLWNL